VTTALCTSTKLIMLSPVNTEMGDWSRVYYLVCYQPPRPVHPPAFRRIRNEYWPVRSGNALQLGR